MFCLLFEGIAKAVKRMGSFVVDLKDIGKSQLEIVGGKGANLGELARIEGIRVPDGFCISADAFKRIIGESSRIIELLDELSGLKASDRHKIGQLGSEIRRIIEEIAIPTNIKEEIIRRLSGFDENMAFAVRSSATAEDLPAASFAGQQDTYLNINGKDAILKHISRCWASLYTERAIIYRLQNGFSQHKVSLAVVIQKMVFAQASGILFTADPVTSNRKVLSIEAVTGLGEALVSGLVNADIYKVLNGRIISKKVPDRKSTVLTSKGTAKKQEIESHRQSRQVLTNGRILQLGSLGRMIEEHFGSPQDIEWCLDDDEFYFVQSRPITTLYPVPSSPRPVPGQTLEEDDQENHVYVSVGHNQMMTDAMKPLGLSFFQLTTPGHMHAAGGRLFVDVANHLASPGSRKKIIETFGKSDPLIKDALLAIVRRKGFIRRVNESEAHSAGYVEKVLPRSYLAQFENNPEIVADLIRNSEESAEKLKQEILAKSGTDLFDFILEDIVQLKKILFNPQSWEAIKIGMYASHWINKKMLKWLGEKNAADILSQSVPNNVTSEMGLALLDVADVIRPYPEVLEYLHQVKDDDFLEDLGNFQGGRESRDAIKAYLKKYGMRCAGEIDITRTRWSEKPATIIPMILNNIKNFGPNESDRRFQEGRVGALKKEQEILDRLAALPGGRRKAGETRRMIGLMRNFTGYREYPKYGMINRYFIYKQALLKEAAKLVQSVQPMQEEGLILEKEDLFYLTFEELREAVRINKPDYQVIRRRKEDFKVHERLTPPRVITSDGEIISGKYKRENLPGAAIAGLPVSSGVTEGRARVITDMKDADLEEGDILVTRYTDPSWTPLFISIKGLVTEVGGLMTHGAVIAREYGLPAVIGVENATRAIKDGQRIRINGTEGYVEIL